MTVAFALIVVLSLLVAAFGYTAWRWQDRAEFWERTYLKEAASFDHLLDEVERYTKADRRIVQAWRESRGRGALK
jgi:hypothetical protein